jgi:hypothetical protein
MFSFCTFARDHIEEVENSPGYLPHQLFTPDEIGVLTKAVSSTGQAIGDFLGQLHSKRLVCIVHDVIPMFRRLWFGSDEIFNDLKMLQSVIPRWNHWNQPRKPTSHRNLVTILSEIHERPFTSALHIQAGRPSAEQEPAKAKLTKQEKKEEKQRQQRTNAKQENKTR